MDGAFKGKLSPENTGERKFIGVLLAYFLEVATTLTLIFGGFWMGDVFTRSIESPAVEAIVRTICALPMVAFLKWRKPTEQIAQLSWPTLLVGYTIYVTLAVYCILTKPPRHIPPARHVGVSAPMNDPGVPLCADDEHQQAGEHHPAQGFLICVWPRQTHAERRGNQQDS